MGPERCIRPSCLPQGLSQLAQGLAVAECAGGSSEVLIATTAHHVARGREGDGAGTLLVTDTASGGTDVLKGPEMELFEELLPEHTHAETRTHARQGLETQNGG